MPNKVAGSHSLGDIAAVPFIARIPELAPEALARQPRVQAWWELVQQRSASVLARIGRFDAAPPERSVV